MKIKDEPLSQKESFRIEYTQAPKKQNMPLNHYHNCYEIYYFLGNAATYFIGNKSYQVNKYDVVFVDKFTYHKTWYEKGEKGERFLIYISDEAFNIIPDQDIRNKILLMFQKKKLSFPNPFNRRLFHKLTEQIYPASTQQSEPISKLKALFSLLNLLLSMAEMVDKGKVLESSAKANSREQRIARVVDYINSNYNDPITLGMLSERFYISKYYLCHSFNEVTGSSIMDFVTEKRIIEAEKLLRYSDLNITQVSEAVGFNTISYFITLFKKKYQCTPTAFRKKVNFNDSKNTSQLTIP